MKDLFIFFKNIDPQFYACIFGLVVTGIGIYNPLLLGLYVNVNIRMYNFDDVQCTVIPSVAYGFVTGMNLQLC